MITIHQTKIRVGAKYKVEYQLRTFLGLIANWKEVQSTQVSKPFIFIETTTPEFGKVFINGQEYKLTKKGRPKKVIISKKTL
jgi:hypothetical protein